MKILLTNPPISINSFKNRFFPLNLAYLGTALINEGFDVKVKDFSLENDWDKIKNFIKSEDPEVLCVSSFSETRLGAYKLIKLAKSINENIKIIAGGVFFSTMYDLCLKNFDIDAIVIGEGEKVIVNLMKSIKKGASLSNVRGIAYKKDNKIVLNSPEKLIENLDELPIPDYKSLIKKEDINFKNMDHLAVYFMRGCYNKCSFCSNANFYNHSLRTFSPARVVEELSILKEFTGMRRMGFYDSILTLDIKRLKNMSQLMVENKLDLDFEGQTHLSFFSKESCEYLKKMGFKSLYFGIESINPKVLSIANRQLDIRQAVKAFDLTKKYDLTTCAGFIAGLEGDSLKNIKPTFNFVKKIKPNSIRVALPVIYPDTDIYESAKKKGLISDESWLEDVGQFYYTGALSLKKLKLYRLLLERFFFLTKI